MEESIKKASGIKFISPIDGECLNVYDGVKRDGVLFINIKIAAPKSADLWVNEKKAIYQDGVFILQLPIKYYRNTINAVDKNSGSSESIVVYNMNNTVGKYRISVDDNILFLQDLTKNKNSYTSIFDNPYLAIYKKAHDLYKAKVHFNIYYESSDSDMTGFSKKRDYFNLTMMTDKYKAEWKENSDWLKLSFHARSNNPDRPYINTNLDKIEQDIELVHREIIRFAGRDSLSPVTTLHWGASNIEGVRMLRQNGYRCLNGYFLLDSSGNPTVSYHYPSDIVSHLNKRDFWVDNKEGVVLGHIDLVLNSYKLEQIVPELEKIMADPHIGGFVELMIHEQYFYDDYISYISDFDKIVLSAAKILSERGYQGTLLNEVVFEPGIMA